MNDEQWRQDVARDTRRLAEAERDRRSLLAQTVFLGTLSVLFLLPLIGGAYLGRWLDGLHEGYSVRWTVNLILLGLALGVLNVYLFIRRHWRWTPFRFSLYIGPFGITATVATIWGILLALGLVCGRLTRHLSTENPGLPQTLAEGVVQTIEAAIAAVLPEETRRILPFVGSLWLFVVTANLTGLIPGLLSPTGDLSATAALAFLVFLSVHWFGIRSDGLKPYLRHYLAPNPVLLPFHLLGELSRTLALATRLFGNIMSLEMAALLVLLVAGLLAPVPVLMLHVVEALVQAYIFGMLALIYIAGGMQSREESASRQKGNTP